MDFFHKRPADARKLQPALRQADLAESVILLIDDVKRARSLEKAEGRSEESLRGAAILEAGEGASGKSGYTSERGDLSDRVISSIADDQLGSLGREDDPCRISKGGLRTEVVEKAGGEGACDGRDVTEAVDPPDKMVIGVCDEDLRGSEGDSDPCREEEGGLCAGAVLRAGLPDPCEGGKSAGLGVEFSDGVVTAIDDQDLALGSPSQTRRRVQEGLGRRSVLKAGATEADHGSDLALCVELSEDMISAVSDVNLAGGGMHEEPGGVRKFGL